MLRWCFRICRIGCLLCYTDGYGYMNVKYGMNWPCRHLYEIEVNELDIYKQKPLSKKPYDQHQQQPRDNDRDYPGCCCCCRCFFCCL